MKKLLFQLDPDPIASPFDTVVAYDGGADQVLTFSGVTPAHLENIVHGAIFTRGPKQKKNSAIFIGGSNLAQGEALLAAVQKFFFANFRVSLMLDSNGCNTTVAATIASLGPVAGKKAVILAGTGPVGQRAAGLLAAEGAQVTLTSRRLERAQEVCRDVGRRFGVSLTPMQVTDEGTTQIALAGMQIVLTTGPGGIELLPAALWREHPTLEQVADVNNVPPLGVGGLDLMDKGVERWGKICFGALGIGGLKMKTHRTAVGKLFDANNQVFDAEAIYELAKELV
jgi:hypothetical protein